MSLQSSEEPSIASLTRFQKGRLTTYRPLPLNKTRKARLLVWHDLTIDDVDLLNESHNDDFIKRFLADKFVLDTEEHKDMIVLDFYFFAIQFARKQNMGNDKTSVLFSIMKETFEAITESPFGSLDDTFKYFKDLLVCHSVNRPPWSIGLFSSDEVRRISEYAVNTLFRHFKMYKYAFTPRPELDLTISYTGGVVKASPEEAAKEDELVQTRRSVPELPKPKSDDHLATVAAFKEFVTKSLRDKAKKIEDSLEVKMKEATDPLTKKIERCLPAQGKGKKKRMSHDASKVTSFSSFLKKISKTK